MAEKMKIIPLGGLNEVGKNMTVYEHGGEIIVVDCGMGFPDGDMYGIDLVIPDVTYLVKNRARIRGLFITHGHEDHIGAIPYILRQVNMPVYCTRLTAGLIKLKLEEHGLLKQTKLVTVEAGEMIRVGKFYVEFIHVPRIRPLFLTRYVASGMTRSMPYMSPSGKPMPQSTTMISPPCS